MNCTCWHGVWEAYFVGSSAITALWAKIICIQNDPPKAFLDNNSLKNQSNKEAKEEKFSKANLSHSVWQTLNLVFPAV